MVSNTVSGHGVTNGGIELAQDGFVRKLLRAHGHDDSKSMTQGPKETFIMSAEKEEAIFNAQPVDLSGPEQELKEAQRRVGECLCLSGRTRPDIQYFSAYHTMSGHCEPGGQDIAEVFERDHTLSHKVLAERTGGRCSQRIQSLKLCSKFGKKSWLSLCVSWKESLGLEIKSKTAGNNKYS